MTTTKQQTVSPIKKLLTKMSPKTPATTNAKQTMFFTAIQCQQKVTGKCDALG